MINSLKKLMLFRLLILVVQLEKLTMTKKIDEIEKKFTDNDHTNKYIATQEFS